jgi:hypothetical protein
MLFDRWKPPFGKTMAYRVFQRHHTELNNFYWAHKAALRKAFSLTKPHRPSDRALLLFPDPTNERKRDITLQQWADNYAGFDNFCRLSSLIAATGYLEILTRTLIDAACQSKPALLLKGGSDEIDGVSILKKHAHSYAERAEPCLKGEWQKRISAYRQVFGTVPQFFPDNLTALERLRKLRNDVGHAFGRQSKPVVIGEIDFRIAPKKLKQDSFLKQLHLIHEAAIAFENHLSPIIGAYESLCLYHWWKVGLAKTPNDQPRLFKKHYVKTTGITAGIDYVESLIHWYDAA